MNVPATSFEYFGDLVGAAWNGARSRPVHLSGYPAIAPAVIGMGLGALCTSVRRKRRSAVSLSGAALVGSVAGWCAGALWGCRRDVRAAMGAALKEVNAARDRHWLSENPIAYG